MDTQLRLLPLLEDPSPTVTASDQLAGEILQAIDALAAMIPQLRGPHPSTASHVRGARTVSREFIESMIAAAEDSPDIQALDSFDAGEAREMLQFNAAFRHVVDRLNMLVASVNYTMAWRKAKVVSAAMRTYAIAKGLARDAGSTELVARLELLRRDLARTTGPRPLRSLSESPPDASDAPLW